MIQSSGLPPVSACPSAPEMRTLLHLTLWFSILAGSTTAQSPIVVPTGLGLRAGNASNSVGVADRSARAQYLYGRAATGFAGSELITKIAMRLDEATATPSRNDLDVALRLSTRAVDPSRIPFARFDLNDGLVVGPWHRARISLPAVTNTGKAQNFFALPLSTPFVIDKDGTLCVDIKYTTQATGPFSQRIDCERDFADPFRRENYGTACPPTLTAGANGFWVGNTSALGAYTFVRGAVPGTVVVAWLGLQRVAVPLSFSYGTHPCTAYAQAFAIHPIPAIVPRGSDYARFIWINAQRLADPSLTGVQFVAQHATIDVTAKVGLTDGIDVVIGDGKHANTFVMVYGNARETTGFDPDKNDATSFWTGAPVLQIR